MTQASLCGVGMVSPVLELVQHSKNMHANTIEGVKTVPRSECVATTQGCTPPTVQSQLDWAPASTATM